VSGTATRRSGTATRRCGAEDDVGVAPFWKRSSGPPRHAEVGIGFVASEAPALQVAILAALAGLQRGHQTVAAELAFSRGAEGRVVIVWRNRFVGFVPQTHEDLLLAQVKAAGTSGLTTEGQLYYDGELWRVWVGPPPDTMPQPEPGMDELPPPATTIFGFIVPATVLGRRDPAQRRPRT